MVPSDFLTLAAVLAGTGAGAVIDLRTGRVPDALTASIAAVGVALSALGLGRVEMPAACAGCLVGLTLMLPAYLIGATGGGDVKLMAATGTLLGPTTTLWAFFFTLIAGGVLAVAVACYRGRLWWTALSCVRLVGTAGANAPEIERAGAANRFAYAPAVAAGAAIAAVFA